MIVLVANHLPPSVRGRLKLWFIEPKPNVFVSCIKDRVADKVIEELWSICPVNSGLLIIKSNVTTQGFSIDSRGEPNKSLYQKEGISLIIDKMLVSE